MSEVSDIVIGDGTEAALKAAVQRDAPDVCVRFEVDARYDDVQCRCLGCTDRPCQQNINEGRCRYLQ